MTTPPGTTTQPTDLAQHVAWLEHVLKPSYAITRSRHGWFLRRWDSYIDRNGDPQMDWLTIESAKTLAELLARLGGTR